MGTVVIPVSSGTDVIRMMESGKYNDSLFLSADVLTRTSPDHPAGKALRDRIVMIPLINVFESGTYDHHRPHTARVIIGLSDKALFTSMHLDKTECPMNGKCETFECNKAIIDESLQEIRQLIKQHNIARIIFLSDEGRFYAPGVGDDVIDYITMEIRTMESPSLTR